MIVWKLGVDMKKEQWNSRHIHPRGELLGDKRQDTNNEIPVEQSRHAVSFKVYRTYGRRR